MSIVSSEMMDDDASPLATTLCEMEGVLAVGLLGGQVLLLDLGRTDRVTSTEENPSRVVVVTVHDHIEQKTAEAKRAGDHIALILNCEAQDDTVFSLMPCLLTRDCYVHSVETSSKNQIGLYVINHVCSVVAKNETRLSRGNFCNILRYERDTR